MEVVAPEVPSGVRSGTRWAPLVTVLTVTVGLQCLRALFPVAYSYREEHGLVRTVLVVATAFAAPVIVPLVTRGTPRRAALIVAVAALAVVRIALQLVDSVGIGLAATAAALGLIAIVFTTGSRDGSRTATLAVLGGLALDAALRAAWGTWDLAWQHDVVPTVVSVVLVLGLVVAVLAVPDTAAVSPAAGVAALALGPYLALQVLLFQNLAAVAAAATVALATATAIVFVADGLAAVAVVTLGRRRSSRVVAAVLTVALGAVAWALTGATGVTFVALLVVGQVAATLLLGRAFAASGSETSLGARVAGVLAGMVLLGLTLFLYQLHYDRPLPVSNRWLPVVAAIVLGIAALAAPATDDVADAPPPAPPTRRRAFALTGAAVALATVVVIGVAAGEPDVTAAAASRRITVMTFNVHNAVTRDGQLDPDGIADVVQRVDPDVLVVEEAGRGWPLSSTIDLAEWMKRRLDLPYRWAPAADHTMGNLVFSKIPIRDARVVQLPQGTGTMRRSAMVVRVGPVDGHDVTIAGVHLQNGSSADRLDTRIRELDVLLRALDRAGVVIAGDLNADPGERDLRHVLDAGFATTQPTTACTLKTSNDNCVDWILVTDDLVQGPPRVVRVPQFDHNAVVAEIGTR